MRVFEATRRITMVLLMVAACGSSGKSTVDAKADSPPGPPCTGSAYDPCTDATQCMSGMCHLYTMSSLQVCTVTCTAGDNTTCPLDSTGVNGVCNNMANCKPAAANNCTR